MSYSQDMSKRITEALAKAGKWSLVDLMSTLKGSGESIYGVLGLKERLEVRLVESDARLIVSAPAWLAAQADEIDRLRETLLRHRRSWLSLVDLQVLPSVDWDKHAKALADEVTTLIGQQPAGGSIDG